MGRGSVLTEAHSKPEVRRRRGTLRIRSLSHACVGAYYYDPQENTAPSTQATSYRRARTLACTCCGQDRHHMTRHPVEFDESYFFS